MQTTMGVIAAHVPAMRTHHSLAERMDMTARIQVLTAMKAQVSCGEAKKSKMKSSFCHHSNWLVAVAF